MSNSNTINEVSENSKPVYQAEHLFQNHKSIHIIFSSSIYEMSITKSGGLILTKKKDS